MSEPDDGLSYHDMLDGLAQDEKGGVLETLDVSFEDGALKLEAATPPGPRFGARVDAFRARYPVSLTAWARGLRDLASEIDADADRERRILADYRQTRETDLRQRIEAAVERSSFFPESGARSVIYADILLAAIAEIFGDIPKPEKENPCPASS